jgi:chaperonin cofactor prefoldin
MANKEHNTLSTRVEALLDETKRLNEKFERQISFLEILPQIFKQNSLFTKDYEQGLERPHETWANMEKDSPCYDKNENHKYPHIYHSFNPQLNNITDMINYIIKNCCCKQHTSLQLREGEKNKEKIEKIETSLFTHYKK